VYPAFAEASYTRSKATAAPRVARPPLQPVHTRAPAPQRRLGTTTTASTTATVLLPLPPPPPPAAYADLPRVDGQGHPGSHVDTASCTALRQPARPLLIPLPPPHYHRFQPARPLPLPPPRLHYYRFHHHHRQPATPISSRQPGSPRQSRRLGMTTESPRHRPRAAATPSLITTTVSRGSGLGGCHGECGATHLYPTLLNPSPPTTLIPDPHLPPLT